MPDHSAHPFSPDSFAARMSEISSLRDGRIIAEAGVTLMVLTLCDIGYGDGCARFADALDRAPR